MSEEKLCQVELTENQIRHLTELMRAHGQHLNRPSTYAELNKHLAPTFLQSLRKDYKERKGYAGSDFFGLVEERLREAAGRGETGIQIQAPAVMLMRDVVDWCTENGLKFKVDDELAYIFYISFTSGDE